MRAVASERQRTPRNRIWFIAPLAVLALVSLTIGTLAHRGAGGYPAPHSSTCSSATPFI
jgi:hypothetical protein